MLHYLAGPYSPPPEVGEVRGSYTTKKWHDAYFEVHRDVLRNLMDDGLVVFSPIVQGHQVGHRLAWKHEQWLHFDMAVMKKVDKMLIIPCRGVAESRGVQIERKFCLDNKIPMLSLDLATYVSSLNLKILNGLWDEVDDIRANL